MKKWVKIIVVLALPVLFATSLIPSSHAAAFSCNSGSLPGQTLTTSVIPCDTSGKGLLYNFLNYIINFIAAGVGILTVAGIIWGAVTYLTSSGAADQAKKGIERIRNSVIGLILFIFLYAIVNYFIPGGLL